jgi:hypothetical protein
MYLAKYQLGALNLLFTIIHFKQVTPEHFSKAILSKILAANILSVGIRFLISPNLTLLARQSIHCRLVF